MDGWIDGFRFPPNKISQQAKQSDDNGAWFAESLAEQREAVREKERKKERKRVQSNHEQ